MFARQIIITWWLFPPCKKGLFTYVKYNIILMNGQEFLIDGEIPWKERKEGALMVADSYGRLSIKYNSKKTGSPGKFEPHDFFKKRSKAVNGCGTYLEYKVYKENGNKKLHHANFCKVRLCPMCAWRRSLKIFGQVSRVMDVALKDKKNRFIFVTLTQKNVNASDLKNELDKLFKAYNNFIRREKIVNMSLGWFRALEVTFNPNTKEYHPHFHIVFMVKNIYFKNKNLYLTQDDFMKLWKESLKVDYNPIVNIESVKNKSGKGISGAVAEVAKYTVKETDLIIKDEDGVYDLDLSDENIKVLDDSLANRRLTAFGGKLKEIHKQLKLDDAEYGDLGNTDQMNVENEDLDYVIEKYFWHIGFSNYAKIDNTDEIEEPTL